MLQLYMYCIIAGVHMQFFLHRKIFDKCRNILTTEDNEILHESTLNCDMHAFIHSGLANQLCHVMFGKIIFGTLNFRFICSVT